MREYGSGIKIYDASELEIDSEEVDTEADTDIDYDPIDIDDIPPIGIDMDGN